MGFRHENRERPAPGSLLVTAGTKPAPAGASLLGATPADSHGPPAWRVYRLPAQP